MRRIFATAFLLVLMSGSAFSGLNEAIEMIKNGNYSEAEQEIMSVLEANPKNAKAYITLADMYLRLARYRDAVMVMNKAVKELGERVAFLRRLGSAYLNSGNYDKALEVFAKANAKNPGNYTILNYIGLTHLKREEFYLAEVAFRSALAFGGKFPFVYNNLGVAYEYQKNYDKALKMYRIALNLNPNYVKARNNIERVKKLTQGK